MSRLITGLGIVVYLMVGLSVCPRSFAEPVILGNQKNQVTLLASPDEKMKRHLFFDLSMDSPQVPGKGFGGALQFGYLGSIMSADLRLRFGEMAYGQFFTTPTPLESATVVQGSAGFSNSQINMNRDENASWTYFMIDPGVSATGRLIPSQKWSQTGRLGVAKTFFHDGQDALGFNGWLISADATMNYHFSIRSGTSYYFGAGYNWGWLTQNNVSSEFGNAGVLPIHFLRYILGMRFAF